MTTGRTALVTAASLALATLLLYAPSLGYAPIYLHHDEAFFALNAHAIATTARDINGRLLPFFFQGVRENYWFFPIHIYSMALSFKALGVSEWALRLPSACVGTANVVLMYFLARRLFRRELIAVIAAGLLMLTPGHMIHSRLAMDYIYPVPFLMAWLLCLATFRERGQPWLLFVGTLCLGVGFYSYIASVVMMPLYLLFTFVTLFLDRRAPRFYVIAAVGFLVPLLPLIPWLAMHPGAYADATSKYTPGMARTGALSSVRESLHFLNIVDRVTLYWSFFNPSYLFLIGGGNPTNSTRFVGVFVLPVAFFLVMGLVHVLRERRSPIDLLALLGFLSAPLAALGMLESSAIDRELAVLPYGVLIATYGVQLLLSRRQAIWRLAAIGALVLVPIQFAFFCHDYFTGYRIRSSGWFEWNRRGAAETVIARTITQEVPAIYLSEVTPYIDYSWRFYLIKHHREDLLARTKYYRATSLRPKELPAGTLLVSDTGAEGEQMAPFVAAGELKTVTSIAEPDGKVTFMILER